MLISFYLLTEANFRICLYEMERENCSLKTENASLKAIYAQLKQRVESFENKVIIHESSIDQLNKKLRCRDNEIKELRAQLDQKQQLLNQKEIEKDKQKKRYNSKFAVEQDKLTKEMEAKMQQQKNDMQDRMRDKENKLKRLAEIFNSNEQERYNNQPAAIHNATSIEPEPLHPRSMADLQSVYHTPSRVHRGVAAANVRYRRSRSTEERWLEHRAPNPVPLGTIMQPYYKNRKSITKLTDARDITNSKTSKYCLVSQAADTDGEVETRLYKGNVIPTTGGGAQVVFDDVECLKQSSPVTSPQRKRPSYGNPLSPARDDVTAKCSIGIEGHSHKKPKY